jgi:uncharacterized protein YjbI with pentapeptide repeats
MTSMENILFKNTGLRNSNFQENSLKNIYFERADLSQAMISKTSFKNIDLSDYKYIRKSMKNNKIFRYAVYIIAILFGVVIPNVFHPLSVFIGIIIVKVCVYIDALSNKNK